LHSHGRLISPSLLHRARRGCSSLSRTVISAAGLYAYTSEQPAQDGPFLFLADPHAHLHAARPPLAQLHPPRRRLFLSPHSRAIHAHAAGASAGVLVAQRTNRARGASVRDLCARACNLCACGARARSRAGLHARANGAPAIALVVRRTDASRDVRARDIRVSQRPRPRHPRLRRPRPESPCARRPHPRSRRPRPHMRLMRPRLRLARRRSKPPRPLPWVPRLRPPPLRPRLRPRRLRPCMRRRRLLTGRTRARRGHSHPLLFGGVTWTQHLPSRSAPAPARFCGRSFSPAPMSLSNVFTCIHLNTLHMHGQMFSMSLRWKRDTRSRCTTSPNSMSRKPSHIAASSGFSFQMGS
jgi:hypothetical protein